MSTVSRTAGQEAGRPSVSVSPATGETALVRFRANIHLLAFLLLSIFAWAPLLYPGYLQVHSGFLPVLNLVDLAGAQDKLGWLPLVGVEYDLLRGDGPLPYWLAWPVRFLLGDIAAIKAVFALAFVAGGLGIFIWVRHLLGKGHEETPVGERAALLAGVIYGLWVPLLATVYVRGALAEALLIGLLPWALVGITTVKDQFRQDKAGVAWRALLVILGTVLVVGLLFLAQPGLALLAMPCLLLWAIWPGRGSLGWLLAAATVVLGAFLGGGLLWMQHSQAGLGGRAAPDFPAHAVFPFQLFSAQWGYGLSVPGWQDSYPLQLGFAVLGLVLLAIVLLVADLGKEKVNDTARNGVLLALVVGLVLVLLATTLSRPLWRTIPLLARPLTYPWQLMVLAAPFLSLAAASVVSLDRRLAVLPIWAGLVAMVVLASYPHLAPRYTQVSPDPDHVVILGDNQVALLDGQMEGPEPASSLSAPGGDEAGSGLAASEVMTVTIHWQGVQPVDFDYNVFVHAVDGEENILAQWDGQPRREDEAYPMTTWTPGEIVPNSYRLEMTPEVARQVERVYVGLYNWQTGERLGTAEGDQPSLEVSPSPSGRGVP